MKNVHRHDKHLSLSTSTQVLPLLESPDSMHGLNVAFCFAG